MAYQKLQVSILNFKEICRTCSSRGELIEIFPENQNTDSEHNIVEMLKAIINLEPKSDDKLPQHICTKCFLKLSAAYDFKKQCEKVNAKLQSLADSEFVPVVIESIVPLDDESEEHSPTIKEEQDVVSDVEENGHEYYKYIVNDSQNSDELNDFKFQTIEVINNNVEEGTIIQILSPSQLNDQIIDDYEDEQTDINASAEQPCMCQVCGKIFNYRENLAKHFKSQHPDEEPAEDEMFNDDKSNLISCNKCGESFTCAQQCRDHKLDHVLESRVEISENGDIIHICNICGRTFPSKHGLSIHQAFHTNRKLDVDVEKPYACPVCDKMFVTMKAMRNHKKTHGNKTYVCNICSKTFTIKARLQIHIRTHTGEKPYSCPDCGKRFGNTTSLRIHDLIHSGARPHYCKICNRRFKQHSHLKNHLLTHSGLRPFECPVCGKTFVFKGNLTVHMRMHSGETPYICPVCSKGFYDSSRMKKHRRTHDKNYPVITATTTSK